MHYRWFDSFQDIYRDFDFSVCMVGYDFKEKEIDFSTNALFSISCRFSEISLGTRYPLISLLRLDKYKAKGFSFKKSDVLKLMLKVNSINIDSWKGLEDQLGGFYGELQLNEEDKKTAFSMEYAIENIDRIFKRSSNSYESHDRNQTIFQFYERVGFYQKDVYRELEGRMFNEPCSEEMKEFLISIKEQEKH